MKHPKLIISFVIGVVCYIALIDQTVAGDVQGSRQPLYRLSDMARMANAESCASPTWQADVGAAQPASTTNGTTLTAIELRGAYSMVTNETWDFVGKTARIKWLPDGANNYASFTIVAAGISAGYFTTDHSWNGSTVLTSGTWYYTTISLNADGSYEAVTATGNYADQGGTIFSSRSDTLTAEQLTAAGAGQFRATVNDNYATSSSITVAEVTIDGCGSTASGTDCSVTGWLTTEGTAQPVAGTSGTTLTGNEFRGVHAMASNETFNFTGKTARIKWQADGANNYGSFTVFAADMNAGYFTTDHSWNGSTVITSNTWYYTTISLNADGSYEAVTATDGYADQGGTVFSSRTGTLTSEQLSTANAGQFKASLNDAYGDSPSITVAEATIDGCGSTDQTASSDCLFDWAENTFPELFSPPTSLANTYIGYYYRYYFHTNAYLATQNNHVYYLGPIHDNGNTIWDLGALDGWMVVAGCGQ